MEGILSAFTQVNRGDTFKATFTFTTSNKRAAVEDINRTDVKGSKQKADNLH